VHWTTTLHFYILCYAGCLVEEETSDLTDRNIFITLGSMGRLDIQYRGKNPKYLNLGILSGFQRQRS
jgi:hypothetical protein